jgi:biopolymer transport protein ExbD
MTINTHSWRPKTRRIAPFARIDLSSITAAFSLVFIVCLLSTAMESGRHHGRGVDLPTTTHTIYEPGALRNDALQVAISRTGDIFASGNTSSPSERIARSSLTSRLVSLELPGVERRVYVHADACAKYGDIETALDAIRYAGLSNVTFIVERRRDASH